mgnify:CR=1 FL=1
MRSPARIELGSDQAWWQLAQLGGRTAVAASRTLAATERWLKKAVTLDYPEACCAAVDRAVFRRRDQEADAVEQRYVRARVAGGLSRKRSTASEGNPGSRAGFDVAALQEMEKDAARRRIASARKRRPPRSSRKC